LLLIIVIVHFKGSEAAIFDATQQPGALASVVAAVVERRKARMSRTRGGAYRQSRFSMLPTVPTNPVAMLSVVENVTVS